LQFFAASGFFSTLQKELPLVAFLKQEKIAVYYKKFPLQSGLWFQRNKQVLASTWLFE
jgi:PhoPQ-activated pathogenicity-related protein